MAPVVSAEVKLNGKLFTVTGAAAEVVALAVEAMQFINSPKVSGQVIIDFGKDGAKARAFASVRGTPMPTE